MLFPEEQTRGVVAAKTIDYDEGALIASDLTANDCNAQTLEAILSMLQDLQQSVRNLEVSRLQASLDAPPLSDDLAFHRWAKAEYRERLMRRDTFQQGYIMGEPAWDILLDLCIAEMEQRRVSVTSACIASGVPVTTALRWVALLEQDGLLERSADPTDKRRAFVRISKPGFAKMFAHFKRIAAKRSAPDCSSARKQTMHQSSGPARCVSW